ncbi:hypothetical protein BKA80DRAFT_264926 [Phyllosticta citrichinensis]
MADHTHTHTHTYLPEVSGRTRAPSHVHRALPYLGPESPRSPSPSLALTLTL